MPKSLNVRDGHLRRALAQEAARIMAEHGIHDFLIAKRKAAERFGVGDAGLLPRNTEIEAALAEYQRLFGGADYTQSLEARRRAALKVMRRLSEFSPRLVGPVLSGTATQHSDIQLHLFSEQPEAIVWWLLEHGVRHETITRRVKMNTERVLEYPGVRFEIDNLPVEATVFPTDGIRQAPVSPADGRPMRRADVVELEALLALED